MAHKGLMDVMSYNIMLLGFVEFYIVQFSSLSLSFSLSL